MKVRPLCEDCGTGDVPYRAGENGDPVGLWIGHRLQQRGVHEAEDGGRGADAQRQRQQRRDV